MKKILLLIGCFCFLQLQAQKEKIVAYIETYKGIAISEMQRTGVPAAITLAQGILESSAGQSKLVLKSNNHFGIKCKTEWKGEKTYHDDDYKSECFRVYPSAEDSYKDHSDFLRNREYYQSLFLLDPTDYKGWANGLKKAGYATEKDYPQKLINLIENYQLQQFSLLAAYKTEKQTPSVSEIKTAVVHQLKAPEFEDGNYPEGIFTINHSKAIFAGKGSSLLAIANQYDLSLTSLLHFNDMDPVDFLGNDQLLFLEKKMKKGAGDIHLVKQGETLWMISQMEGVRLESILEYNQLTKSSVINLGDTLLLRAPNSHNQKTNRTPKK